MSDAARDRQRAEPAQPPSTGDVNRTPDETPAPATHDLGGAPRFRCTPVEPDDSAPPDAFGKRVDALRQLLAQKGLMSVDELRRGVESIPEAEYHALGYYERWLRSISGIMAEKGVVAAADLAP